MRETNVDVLVAVSPENVIYCSGAVIWSQRSIPERLALTVLMPDDRIAMIVCSIEEGIAREQTWISDIETYVEGETHPFAVLRRVLEAAGVDSGRIGVEEKFLTVDFGNTLRRLLPGYDIVGADHIFASARFAKNAHEVRRLTQAARATQSAVAAALERFEVGMTELSLYRVLCAELLESGSDQVVSLTCCSGERTTVLHAHPLPVPIASGTLIKIDIHGIFSGYRSDIARIAYAGEPSEAQTQSFNRFWDLHRALLQLPRVGMTVDALVAAFEAAYAEHGFHYAVPHMGHSFGLGLHEAPLLAKGDDTVLVEGAVLSIEPRALHGASERFHLEDPIAVFGDSVHTLTEPEDPWRFIGIG